MPLIAVLTSFDCSPLHLEFDNNTSTPERFNRKLEGYIAFHSKNLFPGVLDYYAKKYGLTLPQADIGFRVFTACANLKGDHRRRNSLFLASLPYKKYKQFLYTSITDCTADTILNKIWLRGKEYPTAKAHLDTIIAPEQSSAVQARLIHETLNDLEKMPRVAVRD